MLEFFLIANDLYGYNFTSHMVYALQCLTETTLTEEVDNFKSVTNMIVDDYIIIAIIIVIPVVVFLTWATLDLIVGMFYSEEVDLLVVHEL